MSYEKVRDLLSNVKPVQGRADEYTADCPACGAPGHLYAKKENDGKTLLFCQKCRRNGYELADFLGIDKAELWREEEKPQQRVHIYHDEQGNILAKKTIKKNTLGKKDCFWERFDGGIYHSGLGGTKMPFYDLHKLVSQPGTVFICEGEKDAETIQKMGFVGTSAPNGGNQKSWLPIFETGLPGRDIVILTDNDETGESYGKFIAEHVQPIAGSVKVIASADIYPQLKAKGDITDIADCVGLENAKRLLEDTVSKADVLGPIEEPVKEPAAETFSKTSVPTFEINGRFKHNLMGDYIAKKYNACRIDGAVYIYSDGVYHCDPLKLEMEMTRLKPDITEHCIREVMGYLKRSPNVPDAEWSAPELIPFKSRVYDLENDVFLDYSPELRFPFKFPYDYNPDAPISTRISKFFHDITYPCGEDFYQVTDLLLEVFGNCFYRKQTFGTAVILFGETASNGKSTLLNMLKQMVGRENCAALSIRDLSQKFRTGALAGKAVNIGDDIDNKLIEDMSIFKKAVTGETITVEKKGRDPYEVEFMAKLFFAANEMPLMGDKTEGTGRRIIIVPMLADFSKNSGKRDPNMKDRRWSKEEMEYLVRISVEALKRLRKNGRFTEPPAVREAIKEFKLQNDPIKAFAIEFEETNGSLCGQSTRYVYDEYIIWSKESGHKYPASRAKFTREINNLYGFKSENVNGKRRFLPKQ